jgi:hypothetical protein
MKILASISLLALVCVAAAQQIPRFTATTDYSVPGATMTVLADINGDGKLDIVTANGFSPDPANPGAGGFGVSVLLGNGNGTFQPARAAMATGNPNYVLVGDFDGDRKADIMTQDGPGTTTLSFLKGNGDGTFHPPVQIVVSDSPIIGGYGYHADGAIYAADFNRDGKLDLAVSYNTQDAAGLIYPTVKVLLNNGDGTYQTTFTTNVVNISAGTGIFVADLNGDGIADLLLSGQENALELGNGDGTFTQDTTGPYSTFGGGTEAVYADYNHDGLLDFAGLGASPPRTAFQWFVVTELGGSNTVLTSPLPGFFPNSETSGVTADFNGDGLPDFVSTRMIGYSLGNGLFNTVQNVLDFGARNTTLAIDRAFPQQWYATGDIDGNGSPDMIAAEDARFVEVALNTGGNPPLLASFTDNATAVVTGTVVPATVTVGSNAPLNGAVVTLSSNSPAAVVPASVTILGGTQTASFSIKTVTGATATQATVSATYRGVTLQKTLLVVPHFVISNLTVTPASLFGMMGGNAQVGTITLSGPAADGTTVSLSSSNATAEVVAASVTVPDGATTVTFPLSAKFVAADSAVTVSASFQGVTKTAAVTVKKETVDITITKAEYSINSKLLKVEGTSTSASTLLGIYDKTSGLLLGQLSLQRGKFSGQVFFPLAGPVSTVVVQTSLGEAGTSAVVQK